MTILQYVDWSERKMPTCRFQCVLASSCWPALILMTSLATAFMAASWRTRSSSLCLSASLTWNIIHHSSLEIQRNNKYLCPFHESIKETLILRKWRVFTLRWNLHQAKWIGSLHNHYSDWGYTSKCSEHYAKFGECPILWNHRRVRGELNTCEI